ncbi:MAG: transglutaminase-like domain-containing protein, partial [Peptococcaceae bacterium]|nr:transglutaminase-like domain-containing protein [Peptococcaceae bacterium]
EGSSITFYLPDASAHAWVEIYADGIGWLPVDFTPGYFHLEKNERSNEGVVQLLKENPSYFYRADYEVPVEDEPPEEELQDAGFSLRGLILPLILLLLVLVYFGARGIYRGALRRRFNQADPRRSALYLYAFVNRVLLFDGIRTDPRAAYAVLPSTEGKYDLPELSLARFLDVVYKARFSARDRTLNQEEFGYLHNYKEAVVRSVYARQKAFKKLWMRFVWLI